MKRHHIIKYRSIVLNKLSFSAPQNASNKILSEYYTKTGVKKVVRKVGNVMISQESAS